MQGWGLFIAVFFACAVEAVEALTIVLAAGTGRKDWRSAGQGVFAALAVEQQLRERDISRQAANMCGENTPFAALHTGFPSAEE